MSYWVYMMASKTGTLYLGVTNDIYRRVYEHTKGLVKGFSKEYGCTKLVWIEEYEDVRDAIYREKQIKRWRREKKEHLIRRVNPTWRDLGLEL